MKGGVVGRAKEKNWNGGVGYRNLNEEYKMLI